MPRHSLHWLPVNHLHYIQTLLSNPRHLLHGRSPTYLTEVVQSASQHQQIMFWSSPFILHVLYSLMDYSLPRLHTRGSASVRFHTPRKSWLILSDSENCLNHTVLALLLIFVDHFSSRFTDHISDTHKKIW